MLHIDSLIHASWVIPVEPDDVVYENSAIAVNDGCIIDILSSEEANKKYKSHQTHHLDDHALIPGFINTHTHLPMSLMRGLADDLHLMEWLQKYIWPAEEKWVSAKFVRDGAELSIIEMIRGGTTCFNDMYFFPDEVARIASQAGMRACVGLILIDFPSAWAGNADEYLHKGLEVHDQFRENSLITTAFAPHAPYTVSDGPLERVLMYANELDIQIHMHIHETAHEVTQAVEQHGKRPLKRLAELGLVSPRLMAVHMTQLSIDEIALLADNNSHVIHCPESNLKMASGFCPVANLVESNINVALGTDGAASNNDADMFSEMRMAALLAKAVIKDASALPASYALRMATLNGAKALGIDDITGSLIKGKAADITAVYLGDPETQPLYHPVSQLVYSCGRDKVTNVWVAGKQLLKDRALTTIDEKSVLSKVRAWRDNINS